MLFKKKFIGDEEEIGEDEADEMEYQGDDDDWDWDD